MSLHEKMKQIGDIKSVYIMSSKFDFKSGKCNKDWHQLSTLITRWICWKLHEMVGPSDLSERLYKHKVWSKKIYTEIAEIVCFPKGICHLKPLLNNL